MDFSKFDKQVDLEGLKNDILDAEENGGDFKEVPKGKYEVVITKLELVESKNGNPMMSVWFKITAGEFKNSLIFMNQVVTQGFQIHIADEFLRSLETEAEVKFESYSQYAELLADIFEEIEDKVGFVLDYGENKKGYNTFKIEESFDLD